MTITQVLECDTLTDVAARIRSHVVDMCAGPEGGHLGGALSCVDVLTALYFSVLDVDTHWPDDPDRDRFLLSKGHAAVALYATLAERGFFPVEELSGFGRAGSRLMGHPVRAVPGVELPTGSLGHGLALGCGFALANRYAGRTSRTFVLLGDGELQEGSVWEAAIAAASQRLDRLVAVVDRNGLQLTGPTDAIAPMEPLAERWRSFGWAVREVDGHDPELLADLLDAGPWEPGKPSVLIARTVKGQGLPFLAGRASSHYVTLSPRNHARAISALRVAEALA
ncbi:transketolase [Catellatospora citrea]|uniref:Transketolase, N-terminal subunit n=1 Tax=Catellatospora citrea TaxID=53366 RepID=A0A8J3KB29_9ACTN|nr:transketolase [Catellatospora citrea]RKE11195.1 transketolase subunit A [Catellatospora citrea]GIF96661.1 transketolase, N-terminal subunit [Catellatospora citrea]